MSGIRRGRRPANVERLKRADSAPTTITSARTGVRAKAAPPLQVEFTALLTSKISVKSIFNDLRPPVACPCRRLKWQTSSKHALPPRKPSCIMNLNGLRRVAAVRDLTWDPFLGRQP
jgi:hypothetical protein